MYPRTTVFPWFVIERLHVTITSNKLPDFSRARPACTCTVHNVWAVHTLLSLDMFFPTSDATIPEAVPHLLPRSAAAVFWVSPPRRRAERSGCWGRQGCCGHWEREGEWHPVEPPIHASPVQPVMNIINEWIEAYKSHLTRSPTISFDDHFHTDLNGVEMIVNIKKRQ